MTALIKQLRQAAQQIADEGHAGWGNTCTDAADEIERLTATVAGLRKSASLRVQYHAAELADVTAERDALRTELETRRKSGNPSDRLHNLCEAIGDHADGSEWSREEWNRMDKENTDLRAEIGSLISQFHHAMKDAGWHPGRTDDNLCDIIRAKGRELADMTAERDHAVEQAAKNADEVVRLREQITESALQVLAHSTQAHDAYEDAERYRILRRGQHWSVIDGIGDALRAEVLDAAIDAARRATP